MFTAKKKSAKILCLLLAVAMLISTLPIISVSALLVDTYVAGSNIAYDDALISVTDTGSSAHVAYNESTDYWYAIQYKDAIIASRGLKIKVNNIVLDSGDYMFYMNFGTTWGNQGTDKGGFTVLYDKAGTFAVYENNGTYQPPQNDPYAVVATVDPLTSAGFTFDMRYTNSKYTIKLTTPTNTYNFVFDPSHALENTVFPDRPFDYGHTLYMATAMLNKSLIDAGGWFYNAPTPAGISFDISVDNSQGITDSVPAGFDYIGPCWAWKATENGTQFNIASSPNGTAGQRVRYSAGDGYLHSAEASGANINIKDITAGTTKNYSVAICLEMPNDASGWQWAYYSNPECLMLLYDADGDFVICDTSEGVDNWKALYSTKLESCDEKLLRDLDINVKFNESTKVFTFTVNGNQFTVDGTKYLEHTYGLFGAHFGIMGGFSVDGNGKVTMANGGNWNFYNAFLGDNTNDIASFTVNNISFNTPVAIDIPKSEKFLGVGELSDLGTVITPANANDATVTYSSSDSSVVTVDANGTLTGIGLGTATVTASLKNGLSDSCTVTVLGSVDGVASAFRDKERSTTISYQENEDYTRVFFKDEYVDEQLITRQGMYRTTLKKNFALANEPMTLTFKDFIGTTADYALIISIGNSNNQYMDTPGYNLLIDFDGDYAVWSGNGVFNDRQLLTYGDLGNYLVLMDSLKVTLTKENDKLAFDINGTKFTLENTEGINLDSGLTVSIGTCGDFVADSSTGTLDKDATWMTNIGGMVAFVMNNSEIMAQNTEVVKEYRTGAKYDVILAGKTESCFDMDSALTRGEAIVAMAKLIATDDVIEGAYTCDYTDIETTDPNYSYYAFMQKCGYLPDYGTMLNPDTTITRGELVDLLYNVDETAAPVTVNDISTNDQVYTKVCQAVNSGALYLDTNGNFNPAGTIARGLAAKVFCVLAGKEITANVANSYSDLIFGNTNSDTAIDVLDYITLKLTAESKIYKLSYDLNGDGAVTYADSDIIIDSILGIDNSISIPEYYVYSVLSSNAVEGQKKNNG